VDEKLQETDLTKAGQNIIVITNPKEGSFDVIKKTEPGTYNIL